MQMTGIEPRIFEVGTDCFTNHCQTLPFCFFKNGPIPATFCLFSFFSCYNFNTNWKKNRWCAWDSNQGLQDGRRRQNHGAMVATHPPFLLNRKLFQSPRIEPKTAATNFLWSDQLGTPLSGYSISPQLVTFLVWFFYKSENAEISDEIDQRNGGGCNFNFAQAAIKGPSHLKTDKTYVKSTWGQFILRNFCSILNNTAAADQCDQIGQFIGIWETFQSLWQ